MSGEIIPAGRGALALGGADAAAAEAAVRALLDSLESEGSRRVYAADWREWTTWLGRDPLGARATDVLAYKEYMRVKGLAPSTRSRRLSVVRSICSHMVAAGLLAVNPAREVRGPKGQHEGRRPWLTAGEIRAIAAPPTDDLRGMRDQTVILTLALSALRVSNISRLRVEDIVPAPTGSGFAFDVTVKGGKQGHLGISEALMGFLRLWLAAAGISSGPVFPIMAGDRPGDRGLDTDTIRDILKAAAVRAGVDPSRVTPHAFRRSFATMARQAGVPLEDVQAALMHAHRTTTELYDRAAKPLGTTAQDAVAKTIFGEGQ